MKPLQTCLAATCILLTHASQAANQVSATDGGSTVYGKTDGVAIDFDSNYSSTADWNSDLINGQSYSVNSISLFKQGDYTLHSGKVYLGVYTDIDRQKKLSGFLGASSNGFDLENSPNGKITWKFKNINVIADDTPAGGSGELLFILQTEREAIDKIGRQAVDMSPFKRFEGETGHYSSELSAVITGNINGLQMKRALEYEANLTPNPDSEAYTSIPEPSAFSLLPAVLLFGCALNRRRR